MALLQLIRRLLHHHNPLSSYFFPTTIFPNFLSFSTTTTSSDDLAQSLSSEILKDPSSEPPSIAQRLRLRFSQLAPTTTLILSALNLSPSAGRSGLGFHQWLFSNPNFTPSDESTSYFINYLGRLKDFKIVDELLAAPRDVAGEKFLEGFVNQTVRIGRATEVLALFERMEREYEFYYEF